MEFLNRETKEKLYNMIKNYYTDKTKTNKKMFIGSLIASLIFIISMITCFSVTSFFAANMPWFVGIGLAPVLYNGLQAYKSKVYLKEKHKDYFDFCNKEDATCYYFMDSKLCEIHYKDIYKGIIFINQFCDSYISDSTISLNEIKNRTESLKEKLKEYTKNEQKELEGINKTNEEIKERINDIGNNKKIEKTYNNNINNNIDVYDMTNTDYEIDLATGRDEELNNLIENVVSITANPILVGKPGVGKSALVKGLANKIRIGEVPDALKGKKIFRVDIADIVSNVRYVGVLEEKLKQFLEFANNKDYIFFMDEFHEIIGAGTGGYSNLSVANMIKPYLDRNKIKLIAATTEEEYENIILTDKALASRFEKIKIDEPNNENLKQIILANIKYYEKKYDVKFLNDSIIDIVVDELIDLTDKKHRDYKDMEYNPRLVIKILDKAFVKCKMENRNTVNLEDLYNAIKNNSRLYKVSKEKAINNIKKSNNVNEKSNQKIIQLNYKN